ncbi:30S ribosomal protein S17 [Microgenomates group bacterium RBG_16_45_19]|nr:ribosomal protein S17 [uncultured bacterium]OGV95976.1 MAG: 30S ribosomal protein S17 [Microgenomates group bacterium RBG_16_45_19]
MKLFIGNVISVKMKQTAVVNVTRAWTHPIYHKTIKRTKKYLVHDPQSLAVVGDVVRFAPAKPFSKRKHFILREVVSHHQLTQPVEANL